MEAHVLTNSQTTFLSLQVTSTHPTFSHKVQNCITPKDLPVGIKDVSFMQQFGFCYMCTALCFCLAEHRKYSYAHVKLISLILLHSSHCKKKKAEEKDGRHGTQLEHNAFQLFFLGKLPQSSLIPLPFPVTLLSRCSSIIR